MSVSTQPLLALIDASKHDLKVSLTNYIDLQVEKTFGQLRNRIVHMIESGEIVSNLGDVNSQASTRQNEHLSTDQITSPPAPSTHPITIELIKQEYFEIDENAKAPIDDVKEEYDDEDEGEYMSDCDECEDCVKGICGLVGENDNADNDADTQIRLNQDEIEGEPNASVANDLMLMPDDVIEDSNQSADNSNNLSFINESEKEIRGVQKSTKNVTKPNSQNVKSIQPVIELGHQSINTPSTSGLQSSNRKQIPTKLFAYSSGELKNDKRKSKTESTSKAAKRIKPGNNDEIQQEDGGEGVDGKLVENGKLQIMTLEVNCAETGCKSILNSLEMWKQHLSTRHGQIAYKHLKDNVRHNQNGQTEYSCAECETVFHSFVLLKKHWLNFHQTGKFECSVCAFVANFRSEVKNHQQLIHRTRKFQCTHHGCDKVFMSNFNLEQHKRIHNGEKPFACIWDNCQSTFNRLCSAILHVRVQHFHLPPTVKEQKELNIIDERDPKVYVQVS